MINQFKPHKSDSLSTTCPLNPLTMETPIPEAVSSQFKPMMDIIVKSHNKLQKRYNQKEQILLNNLSAQFQTVKAELLQYQKVTSQDYIQKKCQEKKYQLQKKRFMMLDQYINTTDLVNKRKQLEREAAQKLDELSHQKQHIQKMLSCIRKHNTLLQTKNNSQTKLLEEVDINTLTSKTTQFFNTEPKLKQLLQAKQSKIQETNQNKIYRLVGKGQERQSASKIAEKDQILSAEVVRYFSSRPDCMETNLGFLQITGVKKLMKFILDEQPPKKMEVAFKNTQSTPESKFRKIFLATLYKSAS